MSTYHDPNDIRLEIAIAAARLIAEDGEDYGNAKRKAARQILGNGRVPGDYLPDNELIEEEVRAYQELFQSDSQPARLLDLRKLALELMRELSQFNPYLVGAVLNGTASEHSDIYLHLYANNPKDVAIFLLNKNVNYEVSETFDKRNQSIETLSFLYKREGVHLVLFDKDDLRNDGTKVSLKNTERANIEKLTALIEGNR